MKTEQERLEAADEVGFSDILRAQAAAAHRPLPRDYRSAKVKAQVAEWLRSDPFAEFCWPPAPL